MEAPVDLQETIIQYQQYNTNTAAAFTARIEYLRLTQEAFLEMALGVSENLREKDGKLFEDAHKLRIEILSTIVKLNVFYTAADAQIKNAMEELAALEPKVTETQARIEAAKAVETTLTVGSCPLPLYKEKILPATMVQVLAEETDMSIDETEVTFNSLDASWPGSWTGYVRYCEAKDWVRAGERLKTLKSATAYTVSEEPMSNEFSEMIELERVAFIKWVGGLTEEERVGLAKTWDQF